MSNGIAQRVQEIKARIAEAAVRSGRGPESVFLLAVSKTVEEARIREAYEAGLREFGENRVQEAVEKISHLPSDIRWHLIGRLQSNKINKTLGKFVLIQSVDSLDLAEALSDRVQVRQDVLLEVNTSGEASKAGVGPEETLETAKKMAALKGLRLRGLMTIGPLTEDKARQREAFKKLKTLFEEAKSKGVGGASFDILSMGMSSDFEAAVEEGSTVVRVGTALFGQRAT